MLAFLGVVVPGSGFYVPTYPEEPDFTQAFYKALSNNPLGMAQIALAIAVIEGQTYCGVRKLQSSSFKPLLLPLIPPLRAPQALPRPYSSSFEPP